MRNNREKNKSMISQFFQITNNKILRALAVYSFVVKACKLFLEAWMAWYYGSNCLYRLLFKTSKYISNLT